MQPHRLRHPVVVLGLSILLQTKSPADDIPEYVPADSDVHIFTVPNRDVPLPFGGFTEYSRAASMLSTPYSSNQDSALLLMKLNGADEMLTVEGLPDRWPSSGSRFSSDGTLLVAAGCVIDVATAKVVRRLETPDSYYATNCFIGKTTRVAVGDLHSSKVRFWDSATGEAVGEIDIGYGNVVSVDSSPDGNYLAIGVNTGTAEIWDISSNSLHSRIEPGPHRSLHGSIVGFTGMRSLVFRATNRSPTYQTLIVWDMVDASKRYALPILESGLAAVSPDGRYLAHVPGYRPKTFRGEPRQEDVVIFDLEQRRYVARIVTGSEQAFSCVFCGSGDQLVISHKPKRGADRAGMATFWDISEAVSSP